MTEYHVTAPEPGFSGESCGVVFRDGTAVVSDATKPGRGAIEYFRRRGYQVTANVPADEVEEQEPADDDPAEAFDPEAHNADEVIAYLEGLDRDDSDGEAEFDRVIEAERAGKARKTVLALIDEQGAQL